MSENVNRKLDIKTVNQEALASKLNEAIHKEDVVDVTMPLEDYATKSFLFYGASIIAGRAIPLLFDGLKHGQRRLLYTMKKDIGLSHTGSYKKSARVVGSVIGLYHPHGDNAAYEALVTLSQDWKRMLPLADGQGNWGSIDGSDAAAQRYTEVRMTESSSLMFQDINEDTVNFIPNYDGTEIEPDVLPVPYPNVLINGISAGSIAAGMASSILPHNPTEIMNAMIKSLEYLKEDKTLSAEEFLELVPGPDFPTGGYCYQTEKMTDVITSGRGTVRLRAKHHTEDLKRGKTAIVVDEIPWGKTKTDLIADVVDLKKNADQSDKMASAIMVINDESDKKNGLRIVIELKAGADPEVVWNYILKTTGFDTTHSYFAVVNDQVTELGTNMKVAPREYGLLDILNRYIEFRIHYFERKHRNIIQKNEKRLHILSGFIRAIDMIDEILKLVKSSDNITEAKKKLVDEFSFSENQAEAIVAMRIGKITKMPKQEYLDEIQKLTEINEFSNRILTDKIFKLDNLIEESTQVASKIARKRKTEIKPELSGMNLEDIITKEDCVIYLTNKGYVKRVSQKEISKQNRGTQGKSGIQLSEGDFVEKIFRTNTHSIIMFIMNSGKIYGTKAYNVPDTKRGSFIDNIFETEDNESIVNVVEIDEFEDKNILLITSNGTVKASNLDNYRGCVRSSGIKGISLKDDVTVVSAKIVNSDTDEELLIATKLGNAIRFKIDEISVTGRTSSGVRGIKLKDGNVVIGSSVLSKNTIVATITENGMVKLSESNEFKIQNRAGLGVKSMELTKKSGNLISIVSWNEDEDKDLITITKSGILNRINTLAIRKTSRRTKGVKLVDLKESDSLVSILMVEKEDEQAAEE